MTDKVLVVAAHPDDEVLGCGGTIAWHIANGDQVSVAFMTEGVASRVMVNDVDGEQRAGAAANAMEMLGVNDVRQFDFPDNKMDSVSLLDVVQIVEKVIQDITPSIIYTHFAHDLNVDHRITHSAVMTACRPQSCSSVKKILSFEVLSSTEWSSVSQPAFLPQYIVDISSYWNKKLQALRCYHEEMRPFPHSRSYECIEALATLRGATQGMKKAEAFFVERILVNEV